MAATKLILDRGDEGRGTEVGSNKFLPQSMRCGKLERELLRALPYLGEIILRKLCLEFRTRIRGVTAVKQSTKLK